MITPELHECFKRTFEFKVGNRTHQVLFSECPAASVKKSKCSKLRQAVGGVEES